MRFLTLVFALALFSTTALAQFQVRDSSLFDPHVSISFGRQTPAGDMANRFGDNNSIGLGFHIKTKKNWYYGVQGTYFFGTTVNQPGLLINLITDNNEILDEQGMITEMAIQERGYTVTLDGGYLWDVIGPNPNSGILIKGGIGLLQHKIRIEHQRNEMMFLEGDYLKGYDRLCNGLTIHQFIGYSHMSNNRMINFFAGIEGYQAWTESRRDFNWDTQTSDKGIQRLDMLYGIRAGWVLHLYRRDPDKFYFN